jgi:hypothetical protein
MRTTEKLMRILQLAGLSEQQIKSALARLELEERLPKIVRALRKLGVQARGVEVSDAALRYAAAYITRTKRLQDAIAAHPDLLERARKLGLLP